MGRSRCVDEGSMAGARRAGYKYCEMNLARLVVPAFPKWICNTRQRAPPIQGRAIIFWLANWGSGPMMSEPNDRLFTASEIKEYLERIGLVHEDIDSLSPLEKLRTLHLNHILSIPFDTTAIHLPPKWWTTEPANDQLITLDHKNNQTKPELVSVDCDKAFNNIIKERRGGYCWSLNKLERFFARLLLSLGYQVSQLPARVFYYRNQDPKVSGYTWTPLCHECLLVDTNETGKFICDVGFGGGSSAYPVPFEHNVEIETLTVGEKFRIVKEKCINLEMGSSGQDEGFTVQRWCGEYWSPCYHFLVSPIAFADIPMFNWYTTLHEEAHFRSIMVVTRLQKDGSRVLYIIQLTNMVNQTKSNYIPGNLRRLKIVTSLTLSLLILNFSRLFSASLVGVLVTLFHKELSHA
ncbi:hypothetical protein PSTT_09819 [Puccinia striiformis]|uniref:Uncharacterized protein n=1 Tax=Puccinia striiformis TaxID=27350 RepID=A0A2S4V6R8_9BASI|nr:hypothetical protein PSTT_09819 [Puccinia striiformis]